MESLIFLMDKPDGIIKGKACANESIKKYCMSKEEVSSPTVALESIMTAIINAHEEREVVIVDFPNAFIQTKNTKGMGYQRDIMKIRGKLAHILVNIAPELYGHYITYENVRSLLYP